MKKARATKILCAVLAMVMVLGTGLSAMAATSTSIVKYSADKTAYGVTTEVSGLAENEMVTYLVHNASSMYTVTPANIDYIDQKNATGTTAKFSYKGTGDWSTKNETIYVGAESLTAPITSSATAMEEGLALLVNGTLANSVAVDGKDAAGIKLINITYGNDVSGVKYNGENVDFFVTAEGAIGFYTDAALNEDEDTIAITTGSAKFTGDPTNDGVLSAADLIAMKKAVQPADGTSKDSVDGNGDGDINGGTAEGDVTGAITSYSNGQIASWNGILANVKGVSGGESAAGAFWYPNETTLGTAGYETDVTVTFATAREAVNAPKATGGNPWGALESQVADMAAAYEAGEAGYTFDVSAYVGQGIALKKDGDDIELSLTVPATGDYKLVARQNAWTADRMAALTVDGTALQAVSDQVETFAFAKSAESVHLEAGTTYTATLDGVGGNLIRLDFIALVPAAVADDVAAVADGIAYVDPSTVKVDRKTELTDEEIANNAVIATEIKDMLAAGNFTTGDVGVKLGTVSAVDNTFVAFGRVKGANDGYGISIQDPATEEYLYDFYAYGVSATPGLSNGGFAIEVIDEDGVSLAEEFGGMNVYAFAIPAGETIDNSVMAGPVTVE